MTCVLRCPEKPYSRGGKKPSWNAIKTWRKKQFRRNEFTDRLGLGRRYKKEADLRFCKKHPMELVKGKIVGINLEDGTKSPLLNSLKPQFLLVKKDSGALQKQLERALGQIG